MHLQDWEDRFQPYIYRIELLAEIPLSRSEHAELEKVLGEFVKGHGLAEATRRLRHSYPIAFVTYLALKAAFNEERGFWDNVAHAVGLESQHPLFHPAHHWGQTFLEIIANYKLPVFSGVSGLEFVTPIRLHGGISVFSLPDFFKHVLLPSVQDRHFSSLDDQSVLTSLLDHYTVELFVDDIVRHFFQHGGDPALSFFRKCRQMARLAVQGEPLPSAERLGVRPYVLQAFENYLQNPPEPAQRRRLPRLFFQPYEPAFRLLLPSQPVTFEQAGNPHFWHIRCIKGENESLVEGERVRVRRSGQEWQTEETEFLLTEPAEHVQVSLISRNQSEEKIVLKHTLRLLPAERSTPLLAFRADGAKGNSPCALTPVLPAQTLWLFYPADAELHFEGQERRVNELHPFASPWEAWQAHAWDLKNVRMIRLLRAGQDICPPIPVTVTFEPELVGHPLHPQSIPVDEKPLFLGIPQLRLPLRHLQEPGTELKDWHLTLESRYAAQSSGKWEGTASKLPYQVQAQDGCVLLDLAPWLGKKPVGTFHLLMRGLGRTELELPFRVWHDIQIHGLRPYYLPGPRGAEKVHFSIQIPAECQLTALQEEVTVEKTPNGWQIRVNENVDRAQLGLEYPCQPESVRVPLNLAVPRLRWALQLDSSTALEWQSSPLRLPLAQLIQSRSPRLRVELPLMEEKEPLVALNLTIPDRIEPLQSSETLIFERSRNSLEFKLDAFSDTLRLNSEQSVFDLILELLEGSGESLVALPVLRLTQELDVHLCRFEMVDGNNWRVHWHEPHPLRHRRLRLWSLWQPWADPVEIRLPDEALPSDNMPTAGWWMVDLPGEIALPPSYYKAQFLAAAPDDAPLMPQDPPENTILVNLVEPRERLTQIEQELNLHPKRAFVLHAERVCIYDSENCIADRNEEVKWCVSHWNEANLLHMLGFQRWLEARDPFSRKAFLMHMFRTESLEKLQTYPENFIQDYLALIQDAKTIRPESAWMLLILAKSPDVIIKALQVLIQGRDVQVIEYIWQEIQAKNLLEADAAQVLSIDPDFAFEQLLHYEDSPIRLRLLIELARKCPRPNIVVWVGYWVRCDAGWGKIVKIEGSAHNEAFVLASETPNLEVSLWDGTSTVIKIIVDLKGQRIFYRKGGVYLCGCKRYMVPGGKEYRQLWELHRTTCNLTEKWSFIKTPYNLQHQLVFTAVAPNNIFS